MPLCCSLSVSGIGPKSALGILSAFPVADLASAIQSGDIEKLETVPGIGKKSAGRLVLELKDKLTKFHPGMTPAVDQSAAGRDDIFDDALSALTNLGYRSTDAKEALKTVRKSRPRPVESPGAHSRDIETSGQGMSMLMTVHRTNLLTASSITLVLVGLLQPALAPVAWAERRALQSRKASARPVENVPMDMPQPA